MFAETVVTDGGSLLNLEYCTEAQYMQEGGGINSINRKLVQPRADEFVVH